MKLVEKSGSQLPRILCKRNPWAGQDYGRPDCVVCGETEAGGGDCRRKHHLRQHLCCLYQETKDASSLGTLERRPSLRLISQPIYVGIIIKPD